MSLLGEPLDGGSCIRGEGLRWGLLLLLRIRGSSFTYRRDIGSGRQYNA